MPSIWPYFSVSVYYFCFCLGLSLGSFSNEFLKMSTQKNLPSLGCSLEQIACRKNSFAIIVVVALAIIIIFI